MAIEDMWEGEGPLREVIMRLCSPCDRRITAHTVIVDRHTREPKQWLCERCHTYTNLQLPFPATRKADGKEQILAALETMAIYAPILARVDQERLYKVTRKYFAAGWSVKDILHAVDYRPDGSSHETAALNVRDRSGITLGRVQQRLREWLWRDRFEEEEGSDVMPGPHTTMREAMAMRHEEQKIRAFGREIEWAEQARMAEEARRRGTPAIVRMELAIAQEVVRHFKQDAAAKDAAALAATVQRARGPVRTPDPQRDQLESTEVQNSPSRQS